MDMENFLKATRILKESRVEVVCIQLTDVVRLWWLAKEVRHQEPLTWQKFAEACHARFLHALAKREMRKKLQELQQGDRTINAYATKFVRHCHFAPNLVAY